MHYGGKQLQCKEWIALDRSGRVRILTHAGKIYNWVTRNKTGYLEPLDRPGFHILIWHNPADAVLVEAFQESLIISGLLEAAIVAVVTIMQSNRQLGDRRGNHPPSAFNARKNALYPRMNTA